MESLYQKTFLLKKTFVFLEKGLDITTKNSKGESTVFINFDRISKRGRLRVSITKKPYVIRFGLIFLLLSLSRLFAKNSDNSTKVVIVVLLIAALIGLVTLMYYILGFTGLIGVPKELQPRVLSLRRKTLSPAVI